MCHFKGGLWTNLTVILLMIDVLPQNIKYMHSHGKTETMLACHLV